MKKKKLLGTLLATSIAFSATFTGCSLVTSDSEKDFKQVIAEVNISKAENLTAADSELISKYKDAVGTSEIVKKDLIAYYLNVGYSYQSNYGWSSERVFNYLLDGLVLNAALTQYSMMALLEHKAETSSSETVLAEYNAKTSYVEKLEYLLTDEGAEDPDKDIKIAKYNLYSSLNAAIDSAEQDYLTDGDSTAGTGSRTTPTGVDTEHDDYYPANDKGELDYNVYTGYKGFQLADSGVYKDEASEKSTKATRIAAYNDFMGSLSRNGLVDPAKDDLRDVTHSVEYVQVEYASQLESRVQNKYFELYEEAKEELLSDNGTYDYLDSVYRDLLDSDTAAYEKASAFSSAMDSMSDTSFLLYSPDTKEQGTFGFVYNILLPFDAIQSVQLSALQSANADEENGGYTFNYYKQRNELLRQIKTTDQRSAWFNGVTDYSFKATESGMTPGTDFYAGENAERRYLFFENNLKKNDRYELLDKYIGGYAYNGEVYEKDDGGYWLLPNTLDIDGMLKEFVDYINFVLGNEGKAAYSKVDNYYETLTEDNFYIKNDKGDKKKEINYDNFIYATGEVKFTQTLSNAQYRGGLFNKESAQYKALAAVNELQYAYTTDVGVLSNYVGYSVNLGDSTGYIKEFETAAHEAIARGAGAFNVCAGDYGWHLIYVTYTFGQDTDGDNSSDGGNEFEPNWIENVEVEGTFENMFFEWLKSSAISDVTNTRRTELSNQFIEKNQSKTVTKFEKRYKNLLEL